MAIIEAAISRAIEDGFKHPALQALMEKKNQLLQDQRAAEALKDATRTSSGASEEFDEEIMLSSILAEGASALADMKALLQKPTEPTPDDTQTKTSGDSDVAFAIAAATGGSVAQHGPVDEETTRLVRAFESKGDEFEAAADRLAALTTAATSSPVPLVRLEGTARQAPAVVETEAAQHDTLSSPSKLKSAMRRMQRRMKAVQSRSQSAAVVKDGKLLTGILPSDHSGWQVVDRSLARVALFESMAPSELRKLGAALQLVEYTKGEIILHEGDKMYSDQDGMYLLWEGSADVLQDGDVVHPLAQGDSFGELALLSKRGLRGATVVAGGGHSAQPRMTHCLRLSKAAFHELVPAGSAAQIAASSTVFPPEPEPTEISALLRTLPFLSDFPVTAIDRCAAEGCEILRFSDEEPIVVVGDPADGVYLVEHGAAAAEREGDVVMQYEVGGMFGELASLSGHPRAATVRAVGPTRCVRISVATFTELEAVAKTKPSDSAQTAIGGEQDEVVEETDEEVSPGEANDEVTATLHAVPPKSSVSGVGGCSRRRFSVALQPGEISQFVQEIEIPEETTTEEDGVETLSVVCPDGVGPGDSLFIQTEDGEEMEIEVPEGVEPGDEFEVQITIGGEQDEGVEEKI
eukprot:SAG31_NODE_1614_length_7741_cov_4.817849_4_plen_634_part_00